MSRFAFGAACLTTLAMAGTSMASQQTRIAAVSRMSNTIETFWIDDWGAVNDSYEYNGGAWTTFQLAPPGTASTAGRITAVSRASNTMEVFFVGADGSIQHWYWYDGSQWFSAPLAGPGSASLNGGITAVSRASNTIELWYVAPNGSVQGLDFYDGGGWQSYPLAPAGSASTMSDIAAVARTPKMLEVWYGGADGSVQGHVNKFDDFGWQPYTLAPAGSSALTVFGNGLSISLGAGSGINAVSRAPNTQEVFFVGADGSIQHWYYYDGSPWYSAPLAPAGSASLFSNIGAVARGSNTMEIWYEGADQSVQDKYFLDGIGWQSFQFARPSASPFITAVSREQDAMEVFYLSPSGSLVDTGFTDATGWNPNPVNIPSKTPTSITFRFDGNDGIGSTVGGFITWNANGDQSVSGGELTINDKNADTQYTFTATCPSHNPVAQTGFDPNRTSAAAGVHWTWSTTVDGNAFQDPTCKLLAGGNSPAVQGDWVKLLNFWNKSSQVYCDLSISRQGGLLNPFNVFSGPEESPDPSTGDDCEPDDGG